MRVKLSRLAGAFNLEALDAVIADIKRETQNDPVYVSDLLVDWQMSEPLAAALRDDPSPRHYLLVMRDQWGNVPSPGDIVKLQHKKPLFVRGKPITSRTMNVWKRNGTYDENRYYYTDYVVDDKGCIKVPMRAAELFLGLYGIHGVSGFAITDKEELSPEISATDKKNKSGQKLHVWYHRFKEVDPKAYTNLPKRQKSTEPKRGNFAPEVSVSK